MEEKRRFIRVTGIKQAGFKVKTSGERFRKVAVKNLSMVGIHLYAPVSLDKDTKLEVELENADKKGRFVVEGTVVWQIASFNDRFATGIKFIQVTQDIRGQLEALINKYSQNIEEQREFVRCEIKEKIQFSYAEAPDKKYPAVCADISKGGMKIMIKDRLSGGSRLKIFFGLPKQEGGFECEAKVVWFREDKSGGYMAGVIFTKVSEQDRDKIWKFIEDFCRK